jgi:hypothetical protein
MPSTNRRAKARPWSLAFLSGAGFSLQPAFSRLPRGLTNFSGFATGAPKGTKPEEIPRGGLKPGVPSGED